MLRSGHNPSGLGFTPSKLSINDRFYKHFGEGRRRSSRPRTIAQTNAFVILSLHATPVQTLSARKAEEKIAKIAEKRNCKISRNRWNRSNRPTREIASDLVERFGGKKIARHRVQIAQIASDFLAIFHRNRSNR